jgi:hypothetical protein
MSIAMLKVYPSGTALLNEQRLSIQPQELRAMQSQHLIADGTEQQPAVTAEDFDFEIFETTEATAMEEMGASSTIAAGSTCSQPKLV